MREEHAGRTEDNPYDDQGLRAGGAFFVGGRRVSRVCSGTVGYGGWFDEWYNHGYTHGMKTAVSIPDDVFAEFEVIAKSRGVTRSHIYVVALREFLERQRGEKITEQLNAIFSKETNDLEPGLRRAQAKALYESTKDDVW